MHSTPQPNTLSEKFDFYDIASGTFNPQNSFLFPSSSTYIIQKKIDTENEIPFQISHLTFNVKTAQTHTTVCNQYY